ncbi:MAG: hypothetical protein Q7U91_14665 [Sideroxyarcus sp.]|nr:hypothetical protein [Sideroxyarcus sp.]
MRSSRLFLPLFFVLALLFAQQGAMAHGIVHSLEEHSHDQSLPHEAYCEKCAAYAQIGSAVGSCGFDFDFAAGFTTASSSDSSTFRSITFAAFVARAPPRSA